MDRCTIITTPSGNTATVYGAPIEDAKTLEAVHASIDVCAAAVVLIDKERKGACPGGICGD